MMVPYMTLVVHMTSNATVLPMLVYPLPVTFHVCVPRPALGVVLTADAHGTFTLDHTEI